MVYGDDDTNYVDRYPEKIQNIMSVGALDKRAGGFSAPMVNVGSHSSTKKCSSKVDGDACKPDIKAGVIIDNIDL